MDTDFEPFVDKEGLAASLVCSVRWIEKRMEDGMPHYHVAGRAKFRLSEVEPWLVENGHIERRGQRIDGVSAATSSGCG